MQLHTLTLKANASAALQVRALKDYCNNYDLTSLNIKAGDVITFQKIPLVPPATVAPANAVVNGNDTTFHQIHILPPPPPPPPPHSHQPLLPLFTSFGYSKSPVTTPLGDTPTAPGCRGSEASPHSSPTTSCGPHGGSNEEIWVLRKPVAGN
ncbi:Caskin-1 [Liparis tanakae]|uniref:Caskin-1 n=1 Tax=Liparis tanakae TaxID=230148 RepID=A0A4Z2H7Z1_9TELE|nr:Caskin-1 [Liparis tanakae]